MHLIVLTAIALGIVLFISPALAQHERREKNCVSLFTDGGVVMFIISLVISAVSAYVQQVQAQRRKKKLKDDMDRLRDSMKNSGYLVQTKSTVTPIKVAYGEFRVAGNIVFQSVSGADNKFLHMVITLSEGEVQGLSTDANGAMIWLDERRIHEFGALAYYEFFPGSSTQGVCATLQGVFPEWNDAYRFTAYLYVRLEYNEDYFTGPPDVTAQLKGRKLYDPRSQTTVWSDNPALVWLDWTTNKRYSLGEPIGNIELQSVIDAANYYEGEGWKFNGAVFQHQEFIDNLQAIEQCMRADTRTRDGKFSLLVRNYDTPVMHLTEDDIVSLRFQMPGIPETPNRMKFTYPEPSEKYQATSDFVGDSATILTYDGEERDEEIELLGITDRSRAKSLAAQELERRRVNMQYPFTANLRAVALEPGDLIQITWSPLGWTERPARVESIGIPQEGAVPLVVIEEDSSLYNDVVDLDTRTNYVCTLPDPKSVPPSVGGVTIAEEIATNKNLTYSRLKVTFVPPTTSFWDYAEVHVSTDGAEYKHYTDCRTGVFFIEPVEDNVTYYFKIVSVSKYQGIKEPLGSAPVWSWLVQGDNLLPADVTGFSAIAASDAVNFKWNPVVDLDLAGYEIRRGESWGAGVTVAFLKSISYIAVGMKPGTHTFWIKAKDLLGNYSQNAASKTITVLYPANYTDKYTWATTNFSDGTHNNTTAVNDGTYGWILKVSSGLSGDWTSPTFDMSAAKDMRFWSLYDLIQLGDENTWEGKYGASDTWEKYAAEKTWDGIFQQTVASGFEIRFYHSTDNSNFTEVPYFHIFSAEVNARYVKYKIFVNNISDTEFLYVKPTTMKAAYWS